MSKYNKFSGLMSPYDYTVTENQLGYRDPFGSSKQMDSSFINNPQIVKPVEKEIKEAAPLVEAEKKIKKRNGSIEGETISEITNNIIKEKPPLKIVIKAYKKIAEKMQNERDDQFFNIDL